MPLHSFRVAKSKTVTREQAEGMKAKAADFMERLGDDDSASDFDAMTVDEYARAQGPNAGDPQSKTKLQKEKSENGKRL